MKSRAIPMHKRLLVKELHAHPERVRDYMPDFRTAEEAIEVLQRHPGSWIVDGKLLTPEEWAEWKREAGFTWPKR